MDLTELFIDLDLITELYNKGFNQPCIKFTNTMEFYSHDGLKKPFEYEYFSNYFRQNNNPNLLGIPHNQQVEDWLNTKNIDIQLSIINNDPNQWTFTVTNLVLSQNNYNHYDSSYNNISFKTKNKAKQAAIKYALTLI